MTIRGIDISKYQGRIDWEAVKNEIDFAIIRAGFGQNNIDPLFHANAQECTRLKIPFGVYWFSYAYTAEMARREADFVCDAIKDYKLQYPVYFDFEYDSTDYAEAKGAYLSANEMANIGRAFLDRVKENGYFPGLYSNLDYINKGFADLIGDYDLWLAQWEVNVPSISCEVWQYTSNGTISGIDGRVDLNVAYKDYTAINAHEEIDNEMKTLKEKMWKKYCQYAKEVWQGKYGNGEARKAALREAGIDYEFVQAIVNLTSKEV